MPTRHQRTLLRTRKSQPSFTCCLIILLTLIISPCAQAQNLKDVYIGAVTAYEHQQFDKAMEMYQQIIKYAPNFAPAYNGMALANQAMSGDEDKTIQYLKTAISYDPRMSQAYDNLGRIYYTRQDVDQSEEYFEKALEYDPHLTSAQLSLAWINLLVKSRPRTAIKYFKMVLVTNQDPKIYYGLGSAYFASNQRTDAMEIITKLRDFGQEELAARLEKSMQENNDVNAQTDLDTSNSSSSSPAPGLGPVTPTSDKPTGMQARLRGKLSDY